MSRPSFFGAFFAARGRQRCAATGESSRDEREIRQVRVDVVKHAYDGKWD
jgi:hypothetical protein